jgi:hypothetical protein
VRQVKHMLTDSLSEKKVGKQQLHYPYKNWSSVMLCNVRHPAHRALTVEYLNRIPGRDLHAFRWLGDEDLIGALPYEWNWLVNVEPERDAPGIAHFTLGGPWLTGWKAAPHDEIWLSEKSMYDAAIAEQNHDVAVANA